MSRIMNRLMGFVILITFVVQSTDIGYLPLSNKDNHDTLRTMMAVVADSSVKAELSVAMLERPEQVKTASAELDFAHTLPIQIGAQDITLLRGAKTGRLSLDAAIVNTLDALSFLIVGHSEMRALGLTDAEINETIKGICAYNKEYNRHIKIVLCVGETERQKENGQSEVVADTQLYSDLLDVPAEDLKLGGLEIAYEPRWAIGGSGKGEPATPKYADKMGRLITEWLRMYKKEIAESTPILYGGSAAKENAEGFIEKNHIHGFLVGGKSTTPDEFVGIINVVEKAASEMLIKPVVRGNLKTYKTEAILKLITGIKENIDPAKVEVGLAPEASNLLPFTFALRRAILGDDKAKSDESNILTSIITKASSAGTLLDEFRSDTITQHPGFKKMFDAINRLTGLKKTDSAEHVTETVKEAAAELESALPALRQTNANLNYLQTELHVLHQGKLPHARWIVESTLADLNSILLTDGRLTQDTTPCALVLQADDAILEQSGWIKEALKGIKEKLGVEVVITNDIPETILALSERYKDSIKRENIIAGIFQGYDQQGRINNMLSQSNVLVMENIKELQRFPFFKLAMLTRAMVSIQRVDSLKEQAVYRNVIPLLWRAITGEPMPVSVDTFLENPADALLSWHTPEAVSNKTMIKLLQEQAARIFA